MVLAGRKTSLWPFKVLARDRSWTAGKTRGARYPGLPLACYHSPQQVFQDKHFSEEAFTLRYGFGQVNAAGSSLTGLKLSPGRAYGAGGLQMVECQVNLIGYFRI